MIHLVGGDSQKAKKWAKENFQNILLVDSEVLNSENFYLQTQKDLFGESSAYFFESGLLEDFSLLHFEEFSNSDNNFFFFEEKILKKHEKKLGDFSFEKKEFPKEKEFKKFENIFELADFLGARDKKNLWLSFEKFSQTKSAEELAGVMMWGLKNIILAKTSSINPGMKDFVYSKNKKYAENFSLGELQKISSLIAEKMSKRDSYTSLYDELEKICLAI